jgi:hypothetical protein
MGCDIGKEEGVLAVAISIIVMTLPKLLVNSLI